jgi:alpha-tubulin suppressor-like RCC1 family protein
MRGLAAAPVLALLLTVGCENPATNPTSDSAPNPSATAIQAASLPFFQVTQGDSHTCAITTDKKAYCWGNNIAGQLGDGTESSRPHPELVSGGLLLRQISANLYTTCGVTITNLAYCWGIYDPGDGGPAHRLTPVLVPGGLRFRHVTVGMSHACGLTTLNRVYCWGTNRDGQLGDGSTVDRIKPVPVIGGLTFNQVSAGWDHTCAVTLTNKAYCWGRNSSGQLGIGSTILRRARPMAVAGGFQLRQISAGYQHACAVSTISRAYCWGGNSYGQLGDGTTTRRLTPKAVAGTSRYDRVSAGFLYTCGETTGNLGRCWGLNGVHGRLGDGTTLIRLTSIAITGGLSFSQLSAGTHHTCGVTPLNVAYCWGSNSRGQLGDGSTVTRFTPVAVLGPM